MIQGMVYQKNSSTNSKMEGECSDPEAIGQLGVRNAAIWQPTLATSYRPSGEILATDNFFQDYKYFYGKPECGKNNILANSF